MKNRETIQVAMIQMLVRPGKLEENLRHAESLIAGAAAQGCDCVVLPECFDIGWGACSAFEKACPVPGKTSDFLCKVAEKYHVCIVAGITEKGEQAFHNTSVFISDEGVLLGKHRKLHLVDGVEGAYEPGQEIGVVQAPFGKVGITICADNLMPTISFAQSLAHMGVTLILSPSAWAVSPDRSEGPYGEEWLTPYQLLSARYGVSVIGVSNVGSITEGTWKDWKCIGNSIAMLDGGKTVVILPYGEQKEEVRIVEVAL